MRKDFGIIADMGETERRVEVAVESWSMVPEFSI